MILGTCIYTISTLVSLVRRLIWQQGVYCNLNTNVVCVIRVKPPITKHPWVSEHVDSLKDGMLVNIAKLVIV
jgi:hypothetical protein